jgi:hypothetical protein
MLIGHFALGFAAKRVTPRVSLAVLFAAAQLADLLWPVLIALGIEQVRIVPGATAFTPLDFVSYPYSHSLATLIVWAVVFAFLYCAAVRADRRPFVILAALVVSHWVLDVVVHRPDVPLYPGGPRLGLGLWNSVGGTIAVEVLIYGAGVWVYATSTRARDRIGGWALGSLAAFLLIAYFASVGPPPPSVRAIYLTAIFGAAGLIVWSWWADRHREPISAD